SPISAWRRAREMSGSRAASALSTRPWASSAVRLTSRGTPGADGRASSSSAASSGSEAMLFAGFFLVAGDGAGLEQIFLQLHVQFAVVAAHPFQHHGGVLQLLTGVVQEDLLQGGIVAVVGPLAVPVHRLELLHERGDGVVHVQRPGAELLARN